MTVDRSAALRILHRTSKALASKGTFLDLDPATEAVRAAILLVEKELA